MTKVRTALACLFFSLPLSVLAMEKMKIDTQDQLPPSPQTRLISIPISPTETFTNALARYCCASQLSDSQPKEILARFLEWYDEFSIPNEMLKLIFSHLKIPKSLEFWAYIETLPDETIHDGDKKLKETLSQFFCDLWKKKMLSAERLKGTGFCIQDVLNNRLPFGGLFLSIQQPASVKQETFNRDTWETLQKNRTLKTVIVCGCDYNPIIKDIETCLNENKTLKKLALRVLGNQTSDETLEAIQNYDSRIVIWH